MRSALAIVATMVAMLVVVFAGAVPARLLLDPANPWYVPIGTLGIGLAGAVVVYCWRRFVLHRPWSGVGLRWTRWSLPQALLGAAAAVAAVATANAVLVAAGAATWTGLPSGRVGALLLEIPTVMLAGQAFPEELLWRGNLYDILARRLRTPMVILLSAVFFGSMHIISQSAAHGVTEHLLYVAQAMALGLLCAAARARTGALWAAIGVHTGFHLANEVAAARPDAYVTQLVITTVTLVAAGCAFGIRTRRATRSPSLPSMPVRERGPAG